MFKYIKNYINNTICEFYYRILIGRIKILKCQHRTTDDMELYVNYAAPAKIRQQLVDNLVKSLIDQNIIEFEQTKDFATLERVYTAKIKIFK